MDDHLIKQLIKLDAFIKPSQREFDPGYGISMLFISLLIPFILFLLFTFLYYLSTVKPEEHYSKLSQTKF